MRSVMVRYTTTPTHAEANVSIVHAMFDALRASAPASFSYATFRLPDGDSFMHVATMLSATANPLTSLPEFDAFQRELKGRCVAPPVVTELNLVDSYVASTHTPPELGIE